MTNFVLLYTGGGMPEGEAEQAAVMDAWNAWYAWFGNRPERLPEVLGRVDAACVAAGRPAAAVERTTAVLVELDGAVGRVTGDPEDRGVVPLSGSSEDIAAGLLRYRALGIAHLQLVLDPITCGSIERLAPILGLVRKA